MKRFLLGSAVIAAAAAVAATSTRTARAVDEHASHESHGGSDASSAFIQQADIPASGPNAAARIAASPRRAQWVTIRVGPTDSVTAWVVYPNTAGNAKAPVVIAIHENTGLTTWARGVADQLAADGFIGIAPDLITMRRKGDLRTEWSTDSGRAAIGTLGNDEAQRLLDGVARWGMALPEATQSYGVVGFCWGGARSFLHAVHSPTLGAAVVYYGTSPSAEQLASITAPVLGLYGGNDARVNATVPPADSAMKRLGKVFEHHMFEGAGHGFLRGQDGANGANAVASREAWPKTVAWFNRHLKK